MCVKNRMTREYAIIATWPGDTEIPYIQIATWIIEIHIVFP